MSVNLSLIGGAGWQFFDDSGRPLSGGKIYSYVAGTTTPQITYTSRSGTVPNTNPIILDAAGRTPEQIWSTEGVLYKYVVTTANDVLIRTWDNIGGSFVASNLQQDLANTSDDAKGDALIGFRQSGPTGFLTGATPRTVNDKLQEIVSVKDFGAVGDGVTDDTAAIQQALDSRITSFFGISFAFKVYFPTGTYLITAPLQVPNFVSVFGDGYSSIIRGNFAGALMSIGVLAAPTRGIGMSAHDLSFSAGSLCDYGVFFRGVIRSNFYNLYVVADSPCKLTFAAFRFGGEVYSSTFSGLKANVVNDPSNASNGVGFHMGNDFNAWNTIFAATNDNIFTGCVSTSFDIGFWLDACNGIKLYGCNAEKGASYAVKFSGGGYNSVYNFWSEQGGYYWGDAAKENGSGGTSVETNIFCGVYDTSLINTNFTMDTGFSPFFDSAFIGRENVIAAAVENATISNVVFAGGTVPPTAIIDNGKASRIQYSDNGYGDYTQIIKTGTTASGTGYKFQALTSTVTLTNLFSGRNIVFEPFGNAISTNAIWRSSSDNVYSLGTGANRWSVVYAGTGTINTSDGREKQSVSSLTTAEKRVATKIKSLIKKFKFTDAVEVKNDSARIHVGVIAQDVADAFKEEGLDPHKYALFCYDEWEAIEEKRDENGTLITPAKPGGNRYGIRYDELLAFVVSSL